MNWVIVVAIMARERLSVTDDGHVFIPPMAFKKSLETAARFLSMQIKGRGKATISDLEI